MTRGWNHVGILAKDASSKYPVMPMEYSNKRDLPEVKGYNTPQIRIKRSGQFGCHGTSQIDTSNVSAYATLPRNFRNSSRRSQSLTPRSPQQFLPRKFGSSDQTSGGPITPHVSNTLTHPHSRTLPRHPRAAASPGLNRAAPPRPIDDADQPVTVSISTTPCMKINRISQEEQLAKQEARRLKKQQYFQSTPPDKIKITQRDLEVYVQFYEKKLNSIVSEMDSSIAIEKRKKEKLEGKLKKLLDANELLSRELAGIRRDLKKCQILTETPVWRMLSLQRIILDKTAY